MNLKSIDYSVLVTVSHDEDIVSASKKLIEFKRGAALVGEPQNPLGIYSERDLLTKVIALGKPPSQVKVSEVMTKDLITIPITDSLETALKTMRDHHIRHLPLTDKTGKVIAMLSMRTLLEKLLEKIDLENESLEAMLTADGFGG